MSDNHAGATVIVVLSDYQRDAAIDLLERFFCEEAFTTPRHLITANLDLMRTNDSCWIALAMQDGESVGIVTVTTMLYVEWGRLGEIGDLYVIPNYRHRGIARRLVNASISWCRARGCAGIYVTVTTEGEQRHQLSQFYDRLDFVRSGRTTMIQTFVRRPENELLEDTDVA